MPGHHFQGASHFLGQTYFCLIAFMQKVFCECCKSASISQIRRFKIAYQLLTLAGLDNLPLPFCPNQPSVHLAF